MEKHADNLRAKGMIKFYVSRVFNKVDNLTIGKWLKYEKQEVFLACNKTWQECLKGFSNNFDFTTNSCRIVELYNMFSAKNLTKMSKLINYTTIAFNNEHKMSECIKHCDETSKVWAPEMKKSL